MTQQTAEQVDTNPEPETGDQSERGNALRKAYGAATTRLREAHRSEFDKFYSEEAEKLGVTYTPRLTPEQKAEQQLADLLAEYPHLAERIQK